MRRAAVHGARPACAGSHAVVDVRVVVVPAHAWAHRYDKSLKALMVCSGTQFVPVVPVDLGSQKWHPAADCKALKAAGFGAAGEYWVLKKDAKGNVVSTKSFCYDGADASNPTTCADPTHTPPTPTMPTHTTTNHHQPPMHVLANTLAAHMPGCLPGCGGGSLSAGGNTICTARPHRNGPHCNAAQRGGLRVYPSLAWLPASPQLSKA